jgi:hypothetical protein
MIRQAEVLWVVLTAGLLEPGCPAPAPVVAPSPQAECEAIREPECDEPADCDERAACVTSSLGGPVGCTGVECCGANECGNGCRSDGDCPACRPVCRRGEGQETGYCWNPNGP